MIWLEMVAELSVKIRRAHVEIMPDATDGKRED